MFIAKTNHKIQESCYLQRAITYILAFSLTNVFLTTHTSNENSYTSNEYI